MGLFDINMPLLYGEGKKAFHRLQLELLRISNDHSIFAWKARHQRGSRDLDRTGALAESPLQFKYSGQITAGDNKGALRSSSSTISMTNIGLSIRLPLYPRGKENIAVLNCKDEKQREVGIYLAEVAPTRYCRVYLNSFANDDLWEIRKAQATTQDLIEARIKDIYIAADVQAEGKTSYWAYDRVVDFLIAATPTKEQPFTLKEALRFDGGHLVDDTFKLIPSHGSVNLSLQSSDEGLGLRFETSSGESFGLVLGRYYDRVCSDVLLVSTEQRFDKIAISSLDNVESSVYGDQKWEYYRDRISFTLPSSQSINVSIKRLPTIKNEQEDYYKVEIFGRPTKSYLQLGILKWPWPSHSALGKRD